MKKRIACLLLSAALLTVCAGCHAPNETGASSSVSGGTAETAPAEPSGGDAAAQQTPAAAAPAGLLGELPVLYDTALTPAVPEFTVADDLSDLVNADAVAYWSDEAKAQLRENGFIIVDSSYDEFYTLYESNRYSYTPSFVTVDAMLHTYHLYFLYLQRQTEQQHLLPLLEELTAAMLAESQAQAETLAGTDWENAAQRNVAYFSVAAALQFEAAIPNFIIHEHHTVNTLKEVTDLCVYNDQPVDGYFEVPDRPGIGNELSEKALAEAVAIETVKGA